MKGKVYVIYVKTPETKQKWMDAFLRERERVREDKEKGLTSTPELYTENLTIGSKLRVLKM